MFDKLRFDILTKHWDTYMLGFENTVKVSLIALVASFVLGTIIAVMRIAPFKPLNWLGTIYVEFIRNIPLLLIVLLFFWRRRRSACRLTAFNPARWR